MNIHEFENSFDAYDIVQCDETIKNGDILLIESEGVVGLANTWPVAVTVETGELHGIKDDCDIVRLVENSRWSIQQVIGVVNLAIEMGFPVKEAFVTYAGIYGNGRD